MTRRHVSDSNGGTAATVQPKQQQCPSISDEQATLLKDPQAGHSTFPGMSRTFSVSTSPTAFGRQCARTSRAWPFPLLLSAPLCADQHRVSIFRPRRMPERMGGERDPTGPSECDSVIAEKRADITRSAAPESSTVSARNLSPRLLDRCDKRQTGGWPGGSE
jgi:hypothetical protein